jgi:hypothetical protein
MGAVNVGAVAKSSSIGAVGCSAELTVSILYRSGIFSLTLRINEERLHITLIRGASGGSQCFRKVSES